MQLATSQRPHPPPVPPRPSRQVVAEALKRSPRPPCPTRQAPPPPNTKPWRSDQQQVQQQLQQQVDSTGGRTIVYESIKECTKDSCRDESVSNDRNQRDRAQPRNTERNVEDGRSENEGRVPSSYDQPHGTGTTSEKLYPTGNVPVNIVRKRNSLTEDQRPQRKLEIRRNSRGKESAGGLSCHRVERCKDTLGKEQPRDSSIVASMEKFETAATTTTTTTKPLLAMRPVNVSFEDERRASSSSPDSAGGRVMVSHADKCNGDPERADGHDTRPTPTCRAYPGEQQSQQQQETSGKPTENDDVTTVSSYERSTSVPSVDRAAAAAATLLVVDDEPERKIALSDHEDSNDNDSDSNIHRQDWLEAGVHYSSTQITLHGDDGDDDAVDRDRVNGYDHHEEERITDLDFIR